MQARHEQRLLLLLGKRMIRCQGGTCQAECRGPSPQRTCPLQPQIRSLCCSVWMVASTPGHQASMVVNSTLPGFLLLLAGPRRWRRTSSSPWLGCQHTLGPGCTHEASHTTAKRRQWTSCPGCPRWHSGDCLDSSLTDTRRYQGVSRQHFMNGHTQTHTASRKKKSDQRGETRRNQPTCSAQLCMAPATLNSGDRIGTQSEPRN